MKLRQLPEDFIVEEVIPLPETIPGQYQLYPVRDQRSYGVYLLEKKSITTLDAVEIISRIWKKKRVDIGFCGLKDKHAYARQYLTIKNGPKKNLELRAFSLKYLGEREKNLEIGDLIKNRFEILVRDLRKEEIDALKKRTVEVEISGCPNYFDYQRFGSARPTGEFIAKSLIKKDYEKALKWAIATPSKSERSREKALRKSLQVHWGKWKELMKILPRSPERNIVNYLKDHPENFQNAFELLNHHLRFLLVSSYQSYLWNEVLKLFLSKNLPQEDLTETRYQVEKFSFNLLFYKSLSEEKISKWKFLTFPLPAYNLKLENDLKEIYGQIFSREGLKPEDFKLRGMKTTYFLKGERKVIIFPEELKVLQVKPDELNKNRLAVRISFSLPSGSYATVIIKRLTC